MRVIEHADVPAFGLVDVGSYATPLELRAGHLLQAVIPTGHRCSCECARDCSYVELAAGALDGLIDGDSDIVATTGRLVAGDILGSREAGTLLIERTEAGALVTLTNAETPAAASVRAAAAVSPIHVRPVLNDDLSASVKAGDVRRYSAAVFGVLLCQDRPPGPPRGPGARRGGRPRPRGPSPEATVAVVVHSHEPAYAQRFQCAHRRLGGRAAGRAARLRGPARQHRRRRADVRRLGNDRVLLRAAGGLSRSTTLLVEVLDRAELVDPAGWWTPRPTSINTLEAWGAGAWADVSADHAPVDPLDRYRLDAGWWRFTTTAGADARRRTATRCTEAHAPGRRMVLHDTDPSGPGAILIALQHHPPERRRLAAGPLLFPRRSGGGLR